MKRNRIAFILLVAIFAGMAYGVTRLFLARFAHGDVYPPYSSLRTDPLGTRVFFESLRALPRFQPERNFTALNRMDLTPDSVLLFLGDSVAYRPNEDTLPPDTAALLTRFMRSGGRVVVTLMPRPWREDRARPDQDAPATRQRKNTSSDGDEGRTGQPEEKKTPPDKNKTGRGPDPSHEKNEDVTLTNWLDTAFAVAPIGEDTVAQATTNALARSLPGAMACHTSLCFSNASREWLVLYERQHLPLVMERRIGKGSIAVSTLSFFVSNEALRDARHPELLLWLLGNYRRVIFDETHHGCIEEPGIGSLIRKYRLGWMILNLLLLAILFVWQRGTSVVPPQSPDGEPERDVASGKDSATGLVNLLRRNIPARQVLQTCLETWERTALKGGRQHRVRLARAKALVESERLLAAGNPAEGYNRICAALKKDLIVNETGEGATHAR